MHLHVLHSSSVLVSYVVEVEIAKLGLLLREILVAHVSCQSVGSGALREPALLTEMVLLGGFGHGFPLCSLLVEGELLLVDGRKDLLAHTLCRIP